MKIECLNVYKDDKKMLYSFDNNTMIYSVNNSRGKTTLIRSILYALGYPIPATEGIGSFDELLFEILITNRNKKYILKREGNVVKLYYEDKTFEYKLPEQENELHCVLFGIDNDIVLNNLLAVYYIDQEKGWTLLNRGKIIGNIRFNIEEFVAGISNISIQNLLVEKKVLNKEIKKYRYIKNAIDINKEFADEEDDTVEEYEKVSMNELMQLQKEKQLELKKVKNEIKKIEKIILKNDEFAQMIENYGIIIEYKGEKIVLKKENLMHYDNIQDLMQIQIKKLKLKMNKLDRDLDVLLDQINSKNTLFQTEDLLETMQKSIESMGVDVSQVDTIIRQLSQKRNNINRDIKNKLMFKNDQLNDFYEIIHGYAEELGIDKYVSEKTPKYVLTNKLKGLSGKVLTQMCFIFKLSYIKAIEKNYDLFLPIIMDSPRTNELSEESTNQMMQILKRDFSRHQIITASIYMNDVIDFKLLDLEQGLFDSKFEVNS